MARCNCGFVRRQGASADPLTARAALDPSRAGRWAGPAGLLDSRYDTHRPARTPLPSPAPDGRGRAHARNRATTPSRGLRPASSMRRRRRFRRYSINTTVALPAVTGHAEALMEVLEGLARQPRGSARRQPNARQGAAGCAASLGGRSGNRRWNTRRGSRTAPWYSPMSTPNSSLLLGAPAVILGEGEETARLHLRRHFAVRSLRTLLQVVKPGVSRPIALWSVFG